VHHYSLFRLFSIELCSYSRSSLKRSLVFVSHVSLCYVWLVLDICCVLYVGSFSLCLAVWFAPYCVYLMGFGFFQRYGLCWGGGLVV